MTTPRDILTVVKNHTKARELKKQKELEEAQTGYTIEPSADPALAIVEDTPPHIKDVERFATKQFLYGSKELLSGEKDVPFNIDYSMENISNWIQHLWQLDFNYVYTDKNGHKTLIKHQGFVQDKTSGLNPIHAHEEQLQALQYLRGMLLIAENTEPGNESFKKDIQGIFEAYLKRNANVDLTGKKSMEQNTHWLAEEFAKSLVKHVPSENNKGKPKRLSIKKARKQVTMAKDAAILLEANIPSICTISETNQKVSIELSTPVKIASGAKTASENYYEQHFRNLDRQVWFTDAKKSAGFGEKQTSWLDNFFTKHYARIAAAGVPALTSARWLPTPANNQTTQTMVLTREKILPPDEEIPPLHKASFKGNATNTSFIRMGITSAYGIKNVKQQEQLAIEQLKEIIRLELEQKIREYKSKYEVAEGDKIDFYVSYQTLLSPHVIESMFYGLHNDNNARFIEMAKKAIDEVSAEYQTKIISDANIHILHTNAAINDKADWVTAKEFPEDWVDRETKLKATAESAEQFFTKNKKSLEDAFSAVAKTAPSANLNLDKTLEEINNFLTGATSTAPSLGGLKVVYDLLREGKLKKEGAELEGLYIGQDLPEDFINQELQAEMANRLESAVALRKLMNNDVPFKELDKYQRNLMMAALEFHCMGSQALSLVGCKSARDRTAIFAAAVKTMQENPAAMYDWKVLNEGIINSLKQGHHFRAMLYHSAVVKISAVHSYFMSQMPKQIQTRIKSLKKFSKTLEEFSTSLSERFKESTAHILKKMNVGKKQLSTQPRVAPQQKYTLTETMQIAIELQKQFIAVMERSPLDFEKAMNLKNAIEQVGNYINPLATKKDQPQLHELPSALAAEIQTKYELRNLVNHPQVDLGSQETGNIQVKFIEAIEKFKEEESKRSKETVANDSRPDRAVDDEDTVVTSFKHNT